MVLALCIVEWEVEYSTAVVSGILYPTESAPVCVTSCDGAGTASAHLCWTYGEKAGDVVVVRSCEYGFVAEVWSTGSVVALVVVESVWSLCRRLFVFGLLMRFVGRVVAVCVCNWGVHGSLLGGIVGIRSCVWWAVRSLCVPVRVGD